MTLLAATGGPCRSSTSRPRRRSRSASVRGLIRRSTRRRCPAQRRPLGCRPGTCDAGGGRRHVEGDAEGGGLAPRQPRARRADPRSRRAGVPAPPASSSGVLLVALVLRLAGSLLLLLFPACGSASSPSSPSPSAKSPEAQLGRLDPRGRQRRHAGKFSAVLPGFGIGIAGKHPSAHMSRPVTRSSSHRRPAAAADDAPPPASDEATLLLPTFDRPIVSRSRRRRGRRSKGRVALLDTDPATCCSTPSRSSWQYDDVHAVLGPFPSRCRGIWQAHRHDVRRAIIAWPTEVVHDVHHARRRDHDGRSPSPSPPRSLWTGVYQGSALGLKEARKLIALVSHPVSDATAAGMAKKAAEVLPHVIHALESDGPLLPGAEPPRRRTSDLCLAGACPR